MNYVYHQQPQIINFERNPSYHVLLSLQVGSKESVHRVDIWRNWHSLWDILRVVYSPQDPRQSCMRALDFLFVKITCECRAQSLRIV